MDSPVALITGASRGLGRSLALAFAKRGYAIALNYRENKNEAGKTADAIRKAGVHVLVLPADVRSSADVNAMVTQISVEWGRIDVLVNNAGHTRDRTLIKMSDDEWRDVIASNLDGSFFCTRAVLPLMRKQGGGSILNIASYLALRGAKGAANYAAAKAALVSLTQSTAIEEGANKIRANVLLPGFHPTDINRAYWEKNEAQIRAQHLLPMLHDRDEMARFAVSVAELSSVTGQTFAFESRIL